MIRTPRCIAVKRSMSAWLANNEVCSAARYARHLPEQQLLYQLIEQCYPRFLAALAEQEQQLPKYVQHRVVQIANGPNLRLKWFWSPMRRAGLRS